MTESNKQIKSLSAKITSLENTINTLKKTVDTLKDGVFDQLVAIATSVEALSKRGVKSSSGKVSNISNKKTSTATAISKKKQNRKTFFAKLMSTNMEKIEKWLQDQIDNAKDPVKTQAKNAQELLKKIHAQHQNDPKNANKTEQEKRKKTGHRFWLAVLQNNLPKESRFVTMYSWIDTEKKLAEANNDSREVSKPN